MIVSALIFIIAVLSVLQDERRRMTALVYTLFTLCHELFFQGLDGYLYFLTASLMGVSIMTIIANLHHTTRLTENLMEISFLLIINNVIGWVMWMAYIDLFFYEVFASLLYFSVIVSLLNWDGAENGNYEMDSWFDRFRVHNYSGAYRHIELSGKD